MAAGLLLLTTALVGATLAVSAPSSAREVLTTGEGAAVALPPAAPGVIRITQANLLSGQPALEFQSDAATVLSNQPDFITYNEVPWRHDIFLAPPGYALWRTPGRVHRRHSGRVAHGPVDRDQPGHHDGHLQGGQAPRPEGRNGASATPTGSSSRASTVTSSR